MCSSITYRPVFKTEQTNAIELWQTVFEPKADGYFERYFSPSASPLYQEGDTLGAWSDNERLVSVVHIRRMMVRSSDNEMFLCGVISNVVTDEEFRNRGLSKDLLLQAVEKMKDEHFDLSMLGTGRSQHYLRLGWETLRIRVQYVINTTNEQSAPHPDASWTPSSSISSYDQLFNIYSAVPRRYQFDRCSPSTFESWMGWHWQNDSAYIHILPNQRGYAVISQTDGKDCPPCITEYRAINQTTENTLLQTAAAEIRRRYRHKSFLLQTLPQHTTLESLGWNEPNLVFELNEDIMIQNIQLNDEQYQTIKLAFETEDGRATIWPGEYF